MAIPSASSFFTSPNLAFNPHSSSPSLSSSLRFGRARISAAYATATPSSLYDVLGIPVGADSREVKAAYRRLARVLHPDVGGGESSADEFMKVQSAYSTLADPAKRADYDRSLVQRRAGYSSMMRSESGYRSQRWETDQCW